MKICTRCNQEKPLSEFNKRGEGYQQHCRVCQSELHRDYYSRNKTGRREQIRARTKVQIAKNREYVLSYLREHPCVDCGDARIPVLQFDHVRDNKIANVAKLSGQGYSMKMLVAEVAKCEVRCANCHSIVTAQRAGWEWKFE